MWRLTVILTIAAILPCWAVPQRINYQGSLTRPDGTLLDSTVSLTFQIYDAVSGGTSLWTETHPSVVVSTGLFNVLLGNHTALMDIFSANRWLGITIGDDAEMTPRQQIVSVAHAYRVGTVDGASGGTIGGDVVIAGKAKIGTDNANTGSYAFVAGESDTASGSHAAVGGGLDNRAIGSYDVVSGGRQNDAENSYSAVGGGYSNEATAFGSAIAGGYNNSVSSSYGFVGGGSTNSSNGLYATASGGRENNCLGNYTHIGGGYSNTTDDSCSAIVGGRDNVVDSSYSFIGGGRGNHTTQSFSTIVGGYTNSADGGAFIGGGSSNRAEWFAVVGGGAANSANAADAALVGGYSNEIGYNGHFSFIGAGEANYLDGAHSVLVGGENNTVRGAYAVVCGGGGTGAIDSNSANGDYSVVPGGRHNLADGDYSFAAGRRARAVNNGAFVWADQTNVDFASTATNQFNVRASGGVRIFTNADADWGVTLDDADNTWNSVCDSTRKTKIAREDGAEVLRKLADVPIFRWYRREGDPTVQHIGPMAQDFWNAFHAGSDSLKISTVDPDGVALAAIQELAKQNLNLHKSNESLQAEIRELRSLVQGLIARGN